MTWFRKKNRGFSSGVNTSGARDQVPYANHNHSGPGPCLVCVGQIAAIAAPFGAQVMTQADADQDEIRHWMLEVEAASDAADD